MTTFVVTVTDQDGRSGTVTFDVVQQTERERRAALVGVSRPQPGDYGVYAGVARAAQSGVTIAPGGLVENKTITGRINLPAQGGQTNAPMVLRNCELLGPLSAPAGGDGIIAGTGANHIPLVLEDCTIHPQAVHYFRNGVMGHHVSLRGCDVYEGVDGFDIFNSSDPTGPTGVVLEGNRFHDVSYFASNAAGDPNSQTHSDPLQIMGGSDTRIVGNIFDGFLADGELNTHGTNASNACIMIKPDVGTITNLLIRNNWFDGGRVPINLAQDTGGRVLGPGIVISDNVFGPNSDSTYSILMPASASSVVATGNVKADGSPAVVNRNG